MKNNEQIHTSTPQQRDYQTKTEHTVFRTDNSFCVSSKTAGLEFEQWFSREGLEDLRELISLALDDNNLASRVGDFENAANCTL